MPVLSEHFKANQPSALRIAMIEFAKRGDDVKAVNTAIGNVSLAIHPAMKKRMENLTAKDSPLKDGVVGYTVTVGTDECRKAFLNVISASGFETKDLHTQITDGASAAMELIIVGCCGSAGSTTNPLLLIDASYANYKLMADRTGRRVVSIKRALQDDGTFTLPDMKEIKETIKQHKPSAMVVIPYDNPTGHFYNQEKMEELAKICVDNDMWMISDEAYRELHYTGEPASSIWGITEDKVPGITGRRISLETSSKVWNACGLRIGAIVTDNHEFSEKCIAENTANLSPNAIGQYVFSALAHEKAEDLQVWFASLRNYYKKTMVEVSEELKQLMPDLIVSKPDASIYSVIDVKKINPDFNAKEFVLYCAKTGNINGETLLVAPMEGFYNVEEGEDNPGRTQMRIAYVAPPTEMKKVPNLFFKLLEAYSQK